MADTETVLIIFSKKSVASNYWLLSISQYLRNAFLSDSNHSIIVTARDVESLLNPDCPNSLKRVVASSLVQIVIISQEFLECATANACNPIGDFLHNQRVVALLVNVNEENDLKEPQIFVLKNYFRWTRIRDCCRNRAETNQQIVDNVVNMLDSSMKERYRTCEFELHPEEIYNGRNEVAAVLKTPRGTTTDVQIKIVAENSTYEAENIHYINPYTVCFVVPERSLQVELRIDGKCYGARTIKCLSVLDRIKAFLNTSTNPIPDLCKMLYLDPGNDDGLDRNLSFKIHRCLPNEGFAWYEFEQVQQDDSELPTMIHFACRFGLQRVLWSLLGCPGALQAVSTKNCNNMDCIELAEYYGNVDLSKGLREYMVLVEMHKELCKTDLESAAQGTSEDNGESRTCSMEAVRDSNSDQSMRASDTEEERTASDGNHLRELCDLLHGYKERQFTLAQVEQLVQWWKERPDVMRQNITYQEELEAMRKEYQRRMATWRSKESCLTHLKNLFRRKVSKTDPSVTGDFVHSPLRCHQPSHSSADMQTGSGLPLSLRHDEDHNHYNFIDEGLPESCMVSTASLVENESIYMTMEPRKISESSLSKCNWSFEDETSGDGIYVTMRPASYASLSEIQATGTVAEELCAPGHNFEYNQAPQTDP